MHGTEANFGNHPLCHDEEQLVKSYNLDPRQLDVFYSVPVSERDASSPTRTFIDQEIDLASQYV